MKLRKRRISSDTVLQNAIGSLEGHPRYSDVVDSYFERLDRAAGDPLANKYSSVLASINRLWVDSEKNPSIFRQTKDFEPILQKNKYYRDHFVHSFNVFLLGYYIINKMIEIFPDENLFGKNDHDVNLTWMLASTFHDVAYPIQETETWLNSLFERFLGVKPNFSINISEILPVIYIDFMRLLSKYHARTVQGVLDRNELLSMDWHFYNQLGSELTKKNHGVIGALMLCHRMAIREGFLRGHLDQDGRNPWNFLYHHMPACHAISVHALEGVRVSFKRFPFAYVLTLCDELQDWGRPSRKANEDMIRLREVTICGRNIPKIRVGVRCSSKREDKLKEVVAKRLGSGNVIDLEIERVDV